MFPQQIQDEVNQKECASGFQRAIKKQTRITLTQMPMFGLSFGSVGNVAATSVIYMLLGLNHSAKWNSCYLTGLFAVQRLHPRF